VDRSPKTLTFCQRQRAFPPFRRHFVTSADDTLAGPRAAESDLLIRTPGRFHFAVNADPIHDEGDAGQEPGKLLPALEVGFDVMLTRNHARLEGCDKRVLAKLY